jgi:anti-sigma factor RsiW
MTPKCPYSNEMLTHYHYNELDQSAWRDLESHLESCSACRSSLAELRSSLAAVPPRPDVRLSAAQKLRFAEEVTERIRRRPFRRLTTWGGALATAGVLAMAIVLVRPADQMVPSPPGTPAFADFEVLEQLDLLRDWELLQALELLEEMEELG